uniref:Uncharacterized protein n=1 Tax=Anguilla anguilla TaxID=7936 RepID=A0A0E9PIZ6_ANGAN
MDTKVMQKVHTPCVSKIC